MKHHDTDPVTPEDDEYIADAVSRISDAIHGGDEQQTICGGGGVI